MLRSLLCVALLLLSGATLAVIETYDFSDQGLALRYQTLSAELRCPKCQNQNIADSNAPIAQDLRKQLHQQLEEGASDEEILDYMVARYGEFVRYRPRFGGATTILWLAPVILLGLGGLALVLTVRSRPGAGAEGGAALNDQEQARLKVLLEEAEADRPEPNKAENDV